MIPAAAGVYATFLSTDDEIGFYNRPVVAWDGDGYALVPTYSGRLARAADDSEFRGVGWSVPDDDYDDLGL